MKINVERLAKVVNFMEAASEMNEVTQNVKCSVMLHMYHTSLKSGLDLAVFVSFKNTANELRRENLDMVTATDEDLQVLFEETYETLKDDEPEYKYKLAALEKEVAELKAKMNK